MLKVNVGMSRKVSRDYQSTGFSINLDSEIAATIDQPDLIIEQIRSIYDLADASLADQIERYHSDMRNTQCSDSQTSLDSRSPSVDEWSSNGRNADGQSRAVSSNGTTRSDSLELASNKQLQYVQTLAKRATLSPTDLNRRIQTVIGRDCGPYDLSKREAAKVIESLIELQPAGTRS